MRRLLLTLAFTFCTTLMWAQQTVVLTPLQANDRVSGYITNGNYGALSRELPALREAIVPRLLLLSDALVAYYEGRHEESNALIDQLPQYEEELGTAVITSMKNIAYYNALAVEDYASASHYLAALIEAVPEQRASLEVFKGWMDAMAKCKPVQVKKSKRDKTFAIKNRKVGDGSHIMLQAKVGRQGIDMLFDTGCCFANCITAEAAERLGVKVVFDELPIDGVAGSDKVKVGILPKMKIGDVVIRNASFFILDKIVDSPSVESMDAVLGTHILRAMGEMQIDMSAGRITLPAESSVAPERRNLSYRTGNYGIEITYNGNPMVAHLDTGANTSHLSSRFYNLYRTDMESVAASRVKIRRSGVGGGQEIEVLKVPGLGLNVAGKSMVFNPMDVYTRGDSSSWWGVMGADMLKSAGCSTLDLQRMFLRIE